MDTIILAGGKGNRMEDVLPKPLVKVKDKAILAYQLDYLSASQFIDKIIISLGYKADEIIDYVKINYPDYNIEFAVETEPLGTGGALKLALAKAKSDFVLALNCDDITDMDLGKLNDLTESTICVAHQHLPFGLVREETGYAKFIEKPILDEWVSTGWYLFKNQELGDLLPFKGSLEYDIFPKMKLRVYKHQGFWHTLNSKKDVMEFETVQLPDVLNKL